MPLDVGDFLQDTGHLSVLEIGAYMLLIMHYWARGGRCPTEDAFRRVTRLNNRQWSQSRDVLRSFFNDDLSHTRLDKDLAHVIEKSQTNSANAKGRHNERGKVADDPHPVSQTHLRPKKERDIEEQGPAEIAVTICLPEPLAVEPAPSVSVEKRNAIALGLAFLKAAGFKDHSEAPMNWYGVTDRAAIWLSNGWTETMIVAETKIVARRGGEPLPISYFEKVFSTAAARAAAPLPVATIKNPENVDVRPSRTARPALSSALDASIAAARLAAESDHASGFGERQEPLGLLPNG